MSDLYCWGTELLQTVFCFGRIFANYFLWVIATTGLFGEETAQYECRIFLPNTFLGRGVERENETD